MITENLKIPKFAHLKFFIAFPVSCKFYSCLKITPLGNKVRSLLRVSLLSEETISCCNFPEHLGTFTCIYKMKDRTKDEEYDRPGNKSYLHITRRLEISSGQANRLSLQEEESNLQKDWERQSGSES